MCKSQQKYAHYSQSLEQKSNKPKRISEGWILFSKNQRYGYQFEQEKSTISGSFGEKLLDNSKLVSEEEFISPLRSKQIASYSKYLNKSSNQSPSKSKDFIDENQEIIESANKSHEGLMESPELISSKNSKQSRSRYVETQPDEIEGPQWANNQTFSIFGTNRLLSDVKSISKEENRPQPARTSNSQISNHEAIWKMHDLCVKDQVGFMMEFYR